MDAMECQIIVQEVNLQRTSINLNTEAAEVVSERKLTALEPGGQRRKSSTPTAPSSLTYPFISSMTIELNSSTYCEAPLDARVYQLSTPAIRFISTEFQIH